MNAAMNMIEARSPMRSTRLRRTILAPPPKKLASAEAILFQHLIRKERGSLRAKLEHDKRLSSDLFVDECADESVIGTAWLEHKECSFDCKLRTQHGILVCLDGSPPFHIPATMDTERTWRAKQKQTATLVFSLCINTARERETLPQIAMGITDAALESTFVRNFNQSG